MDFNKVNEANKAGENTPAASNINTDKQVIPPVEDGVDKQPANTVGFRDESLDEPYTEKRTITINLVTNYSLYRRVNDKTLPKRMDKIGSCVRSSRTLSSNKGEIESYFPALIGLAPNNENFISRVKAYLNNISVSVDELGKTFDISFFWNRKRDYLRFRAEEEAIETAYMNSDRKGVKELREALEAKITKLNLLESKKYKYGYPIVLDDYLIYRHCLLYKDVAKDIALINSDPSIRFYFKDDQREAERLAKHRQEINSAKGNYVKLLTNSDLFDAVFIQYCVANNINIPNGMAMDTIDKQSHLDKFSTNEPAKFNKLCNDKDITIKSLIEVLISRGEFIRAIHNQNITTPDGEFIGANVKEAVTWFKNPTNSALVSAYKNKLKNI